ncbi:MAG: TonB family protein [Nitrospinota bacterium]
MVSHYRIRTKEIDSHVEMGRSFIFSLLLHILIVASLLFSPLLFMGKKRNYLPIYKVTLVELPKVKKPEVITGMPVKPPLMVREPAKTPKPAIAESKKVKPLPKEKVITKKLKTSIPKTEIAEGEKPIIPTPIPVEKVQTNDLENQGEQTASIPPIENVQSKDLENQRKQIASIPPTETDIALDTIDFPYQWYLEAVRLKIDDRWSRLDIQLLSGEIKKAVIKFRILKNGKIEGVEIEKSSGYPIFDNTALRAIKSSNPLPPLPKEFPEEYLSIHFGFENKG